MSQKWYPVIDYSICSECGTCVDMCKHGVYDKAKAPTPVVVYPEGCIEGCKGCGNRCPSGAIQYVGDTVKASSSDSCGCGCETDSACNCSADTNCGCETDTSCGCGCESDASDECDCGCSCGC